MAEDVLRLAGFIEGVNYEKQQVVASGERPDFTFNLPKGLRVWLPLLVYLDLRLVGDIAGPRIDPATQPALFAWALLLGVTLAICLALDAWDVVRWLRGERYILGTDQAYRAGASNLSSRLADG